MKKGADIASDEAREYSGRFDTENKSNARIETWTWVETKSGGAEVHVASKVLLVTWSWHPSGTPSYVSANQKLWIRSIDWNAMWGFQITTFVTLNCCTVRKTVQQIVAPLQLKLSKLSTWVTVFAAPWQFFTRQCNSFLSDASHNVAHYKVLLSWLNSNFHLQNPCRGMTSN